MTSEQEKHLVAIKDSVTHRLESKYRKGQAEHGGNVWNRNPVEDLDGEVVDMIVYHFVLKERDKLINNLAMQAMEAVSCANWNDAKSLLDKIYDLTYPYEHRITKPTKS